MWWNKSGSSRINQKPQGMPGVNQFTAKISVGPGAGLQSPYPCVGTEQRYRIFGWRRVPGFQKPEERSTWNHICMPPPGIYPLNPSWFRFRWEKVGENLGSVLHLEKIYLYGKNNR